MKNTKKQNGSSQLTPAAKDETVKTETLSETESKDNAETTPLEPAPKQKTNKRAVAIAGAATVSAVIIGVVALLVSLNMNRTAYQVAYETDMRMASAMLSSVPGDPHHQKHYSSVTHASFPGTDPSVLTESALVSETSKGSGASSDADSSKSTKETSSKASSEPEEDITFGKNVTVEGVKLEGKTMAQANEALQAKVDSMRPAIRITISCEGDTMVLTQDDFGFDSNLSDVLTDAYHFSRGEDKKPASDHVTKKGVTEFPLEVWLNEDSINSVVDKASGIVSNPPVDAHVVSFNPDAKEKFTYADGHDGYTVDRNELKTKISEIVLSNTKIGSFSVAKKKTAFKVTLADVKANTKLIASHHTTATNVYNSNYNMGLALRAASGTVLQPGEIFSFNRMTGDTTNGYTHYYENGTVGAYLPSTAIAGGQYVTAYGGGICQASTTLYNCAMKANLEAIERYPHAYPSIYADRGLDATIDYGSLDMRFRNTLKYPVYIATYYYDCDDDGYNELCVEMYGPLSTEYDEVVVVGWIDSVNSYNYHARAAKVFFKDGKEIGREQLISGSYDYRYDTYYSAQASIPADPVNGPAVSPTGKEPRVYSPVGVGSCGPIPYGTAAEYLKKVKEDEKKGTSETSKTETSKTEASKTETSKTETSKTETSKTEASKTETSKTETSKQETSKQESSKQETSKQESSKQESSKQETSKQESSKQESSKQESSKQESSRQESSKQTSVTGDTSVVSQVSETTEISVDSETTSGENS